MSRTAFPDPTAAVSPAPRLTPKDAATLIVVDRTDGRLRVLFGRRGERHVFMPNLYVFPGGRRDRGDHALPYTHDLHPEVLARLAAGRTDPAALRRGRALALAAVRELREETGLHIGRLSDGDTAADLASLRYVARAITPPGNVRRFDTRFFLTFTDEAGIDPQHVRDSAELHDLTWLDIEASSGLNMPLITRTILEDVVGRIKADPCLPFGSPGPFYYSRRGQTFRGDI
ncbi:NUDIX hydrolase [Ciceribacter sp. RN22]|uniref:NUDIX hydrolase n=1 Tax=Ciceribacter sp. RN22 TaxID=2954932 RepID=UPI0020936330|nr:NUDIX hydrolase [Ciceribacter sp. RN22]MCO6177914.1 NUDIX hydrolase [Ciceribacter sp. RN22]